MVFDIWYWSIFPDTDKWNGTIKFGLKIHSVRNRGKLLALGTQYSVDTMDSFNYHLPSLWVCYAKVFPALMRFSFARFRFLMS